MVNIVYRGIVSWEKEGTLGNGAKTPEIKVNRDNPKIPSDATPLWTMTTILRP